jgi:hypothetical protein
MNTGFRTSTVSGVVGVVVYMLLKVVGLVFPDFLTAVPATEEFVAGVAAYIAARVNKTPENPGIL